MKKKTKKITSTKNNNSGDCNSGDCNSGHHNSGDCNSGHCNSGHYNSGHCNSGHYNSGHCNSGHHNSGHYNSGHYNSGDCNSGHHNSGYFNTDEPTVRMFNRDTGKKFNEIDFPIINLVTEKWIETKNMSEEQKKSFPAHKTTGGILLKIEYKNAWRNAWNDMDTENRRKLLNLPNFDQRIFLEITGIDIQDLRTAMPKKDGKNE